MTATITADRIDRYCVLLAYGSSHLYFRGRVRCLFSNRCPAEFPHAGLVSRIDRPKRRAGYADQAGIFERALNRDA
jgi:hypothetical protein